MPSSLAPARFAQSALHQRRHEPVRAHFPRPGSTSAALEARRARRTPRSASAPAASTTTSMTSASTPITTPSSRCSATGASAIISRRKPSNGRGSSSWSAGNFPPQRLYATIYRPAVQAIPAELRPGGLGASGPRNFASAGLDPADPHRQRQQEGQFLDDGRDRPVRPVLRIARRSHARPATPAVALRQQRRRRDASKSGISSSSSSTPTRTAPSRRCPPSTSIPAWASSASPPSFRARKT